jgi:hypothetical protein
VLARAFAWRYRCLADRPEDKLPRTEAIRCLVELGLTADSKPQKARS